MGIPMRIQQLLDFTNLPEAVGVYSNDLRDFAMAYELVALERDEVRRELEEQGATSDWAFGTYHHPDYRNDFRNDGNGSLCCRCRAEAAEAENKHLKEQVQWQASVAHAFEQRNLLSEYEYRRWLSEGPKYLEKGIAKDNLVLRAKIAELQADLKETKKHLVDANRGAERNARINSGLADKCIHLGRENKRIRDASQRVLELLTQLDTGHTRTDQLIAALEALREGI